MSQDPLCPNLSQKVQKEVSQMANCNLCKLKPPKNRKNISLNVAKARRQCQICSVNFEPEILEFKCGPN